MRLESREPEALLGWSYCPPPCHTRKQDPKRLNCGGPGALWAEAGRGVRERLGRPAPPSPVFWFPGPRTLLRGCGWGPLAVGTCGRGVGQGEGAGHHTPSRALSPSTSVSRISSQDAKISPSSSSNPFTRGCHLMGGRIRFWTSSQTTGDHMLRPHKLSLPWREGEVHKTWRPGWQGSGSSWDSDNSRINAMCSANQVPLEHFPNIL